MNAILEQCSVLLVGLDKLPECDGNLGSSYNLNDSECVVNMEREAYAELFGISRLSVSYMT